MALATMPPAEREFAIPDFEKQESEYDPELENIAQAASEINRMVTPNYRRECALGNVYVKSLVEINQTYSNENALQAAKRARKLHTLMQKYYKEEKWRKIASGFGAEVTVRRMADRLGFVALETEGVDDDLNGIDLWLQDPNADGTVLALQIKSSTEEPEIKAFPIKTDAEGNARPNVTTYDKLAQRMISYINTADNLPAPRDNIRAAILVVPGGNASKISNQITKEPVLGTEYDLLDALADAELI